MKRHQLTTTILVLFFIVFSVSPAAQSAEWKLDPAHSSIYFSIQHIYSTVRGQFNEFSGIFDFDPNDLTKGRIEITVQTQSVDTRITKRDNHLRSADFFNVSAYPTMKFKSSAVEHLGGNKYRVTGDLTVKDVTQKIELPFVFHGIKDNPLQKGMLVAGFDAQLTIDRLAYHVGNGQFFQMGAIGKEVDILVSLEILKDK